MSENKFIKHLKGEDTAKSVLEIQNQRTTTSFANMPAGTSNANDVYSDHRGNATGVLRGSDNWKLSGLGTLIDAPTVYGDGRDFIDSYDALADSLWVDATYTFSASKIFSPNTKFVLKLCGERLSNTEDTVPFSLIITIGNAIITKSFVAREHAFTFSEEFVIDFAESNATTLKCAPGATMRVQLLCGAPNASATLYYGMTVFTALQRRVDADALASDKKTFEDVVQDIDDINDEIDQIQDDLGDLEQYVDDTFVRLDGNSIMTGPLKMRATSSFQCAIAPFWDGVGFYKLNSDDSVTLIASIEDPDGFVPWVTNTYNIGSSLKKWKNLYLGGKLFVSTINNGGDLIVPNVAGTLATKADVDLAANSGRMITDQGVWYAKMYAATVAPAAEDGTNYADFSQVDGQGNPIIVTYNRVNGAWVQDQTITPPAEYDGYVPITSKIWDIAEQAGQQGGRILWNHQSKEFTPYPQIISFEDIEVTGNSTVVMPYNPSANQIVNKNYVDGAIAAAIPTVNNPTIIITQGGITKGSFSLNQANGDTIALDATILDIAQSIDADIVGTLTVASNGDVTGFSQTDYLVMPGALNMTNSNSFELAFAFATGVTTSWAPILKNAATGYGSQSDMGLNTDANSKLHFFVNGTTSVYLTGTTTLQPNTKYYAKLVYDGTDYTLSLSEDGTNWTVEATGLATSIPGILWETKYALGIWSSSNGISTLYLSECYIKKNGILIWQGMDAPGLHQRASNKHEVIEFQVPTIANNYTWYRKYADGWVEQGGTKTSGGSGNHTIDLPVTMSDTAFWAQVTRSSGASTTTNVNVWVRTPTLTNQITVYTSGDTGIKWEVKGMYAQ